MKRRGVWVALVEAECVVGQEGFSLGDKSFVNVVVLCGSKRDAKQVASKSLSELGFHVVRFDNMHELDTEALDAACKPELARLVEDASRSGQPAVGTFHTWEGQG